VWKEYLEASESGPKVLGGTKKRRNGLSCHQEAAIQAAKIISSLPSERRSAA
jgi:hypothetical protein